MRLKINPELLENAIKNATRDHPRVRKISPDVFGVTCKNKQKCKLGREHEIEFTETEDGLFAECLDCESVRWRAAVCRHIAAALALYLFYREAEAA